MKKQSLLLTGLAALGMAFAFTSCGGGEPEEFNPSGKTYGYDSWTATQELDEDDQLYLEAMVRGSYGHSQFVFNAEGTYVWENKETHEISLQGRWELGETTIELSDPEGDPAETLVIEGAKFYATQQVGEDLYIHIYYKVS